MEEHCAWCGCLDIAHGCGNVYWELPDGTRAISITETPEISCNDCKMVYQPENIVKEIENHLFLIDTRKIGKSIPYGELMKMPKLLKRNYFDFTQ